MNKIFDIDGSIYKGLTIMYNLLVINFLLVLTSLPLITIGPSISAAFSIFLDIKKEQSSISFENYFRYFMKNLNKSLSVSLIQSILMIIFGVIIFMARFSVFLQLSMVVLFSLSLLITSLAIVLISYTQLNLKYIIFLGGFISLKMTAYSVIFFILPIISLVVPIFLPYIIYPYIFFLFSLPLYAQSFVIDIVIKKIQINYDWIVISHDEAI